MTVTFNPAEAGLFAVDRDSRTVRGLLVPYNELSRPAAAAGIRTDPVMFRRGDLAIPRDPSIVGLNVMHDRFNPIGAAMALDDSDAGVVAVFRIADTPEGDSWLADNEGLCRLSPEVRRMRRRPDNSATADLIGSALVDEGAFASAALFSIDPEPDPEPDPETPEPASEPDGTEPAEPDEDDEEEETNVSTEVPNTLTPNAPTNEGMSAPAMFAALSALANNRATPTMLERMSEHWGGVGEAAMFALNDIAYDGASGVGAQMGTPQWLGEVLDGTSYVPRFAPLFGHKDLTALAMSGWRWLVKPQGGAWTGNKAAIPSNAASVEPVTENAARWAGGHDHAREHRDFGTPGYFESYYAAMVEDYFRWLDEEVVLTAALAAATPVEADNPAGLTIGSAMSGLIDGAAAVVEAGLVPTFAILPPAGWKSILKTANSDVLGYLNAAIGLDEGTLAENGFVIRPSAEVTNTIVGARTAADVYELPGSPIRAEALNIANGGIDTGLFGYGGLLVTNEAGIVEVTPYTP